MTAAAIAVAIIPRVVDVPVDLNQNVDRHQTTATDPAGRGRRIAPTLISTAIAAPRDTVVTVPARRACRATRC